MILPFYVSYPYSDAMVSPISGGSGVRPNRKRAYSFLANSNDINNGSSSSNTVTGTDNAPPKSSNGLDCMLDGPLEVSLLELINKCTAIDDEAMPTLSKILKTAVNLHDCSQVKIVLFQYNYRSNLYQYLCTRVVCF